jgi:GrpB-like predicted nucleotidyltransferase (UPF0157 family)
MRIARSADMVPGRAKGRYLRSVDEVIRLVDPDPRWPQLFQQERLRIAIGLGTLAASFEHFGSTAIPNVSRSKPVIDILVGLREGASIEVAIAKMVALDYVQAHPADELGRVAMRHGTPRRHHAHLVTYDGESWRQHVMFRDWLSLHPEDARAYTALKVRLAEQFARDRAAYTEAKASFVEEILRKAQQFPARRLGRV